MSEPLQPFYYIRRDDSTYVPLIPVDELPSELGIQGASSTKNIDDALQGGMKLLKNYDDPQGRHYVVDFSHPEAKIVKQEGEHEGTLEMKREGSIVSGSSVATTTGKTSTSPVKNLDEPPKGDAKNAIDQVQANIDKITGLKLGGGSQKGPEEGGVTYQGTAGTLGKKVYCTYWIRTGNCNYMQEGCKYLHEIPPDNETRLAIGVRTYPTWPREDPVAPRPPPLKPFQITKQGIQQPTWRQGDGKGVESSTRQKPQAVACGPGNPQRNSISSAPVQTSDGSARFAGPGIQIAAANAAQHFPSSSDYLSRQRNPSAAQYPAGTAQPSNPGMHSAMTNSHMNAPSQSKVNPFAQRVPSAGASPLGHAQNMGPGLLINATSPGATLGNTAYTRYNPLYVPSQRPNDGLADANLQSTAPGGGVSPHLSTESRQNNNDNTIRGSIDLGSSAFSINSPMSSGNNGQESLSEHIARRRSGLAPGHQAQVLANPASRAGTPAKASSHSSGNARRGPRRDSTSSFTTIDPNNFSGRSSTPTSVKGRGQILYDPYSTENNSVTSEVGSNNGDARSAMSSPAPLHRRMFRKPGEAEFVANPPSESGHSKSGRGPKKNPPGSNSGRGRKGGHSRPPKQNTNAHAGAQDDSRQSLV